MMQCNINSNVLSLCNCCLLIKKTLFLTHKIKQAHTIINMKHNAHCRKILERDQSEQCLETRDFYKSGIVFQHLSARSDGGSIFSSENLFQVIMINKGTYIICKKALL